MAEYVDAPVPLDPDELRETAYEYLQAQVPGWEPSQGNLDTWIIDAFSEITAQVGETAADVLTSVFRYYGANIAGISPIEATTATALSTWTMIDDTGYTVPAGTTVGIDRDGELIPFQTVNDLVISPGDTEAIDVSLVAAEAGDDSNDLTGSAILIDQLDYVSTVVLTTVSSGGTDAEEDSVYLDRLTDELRLLSPRPILPDDFATLAKRIVGVDRGTAINGYNPNTDTYDNERTITVAVVDDAGDAVDVSTKTAVEEYLTAQREVNFLVFVVDPTYTTIDVTFTCVAWPGWNIADVESAAEAAVNGYLSAANWGMPDTGEDRVWVNTDKVRYLEVAQVINNVAGVHHISALAVNGDTVDVTLSGVAPLPQPGTISGTVTAP